MSDEPKRESLARRPVKERYGRNWLRMKRVRDGHGVKVSLAEQIALIPGGLPEFHKVLRAVPIRDKTFEKLVRCYFQLPAAQQNAIQLESLCVTMGVPWSELLGACVTVATERNIPMTRFIASMWMPAVMDRNIQEALKPKGYKDREAFMLSTGILPVPKGATVNVLNQVNAASYTDKGELSGVPPFEESVVTLSEVIRDAVDVQTTPVESAPDLTVTEDDV